MLETGINAVFDEVGVTAIAAGGVSTSEIVKPTGNRKEFSPITWSGRAANEGASFTDVTVRKNESLAIPNWLSATVTVMVAVPNALGVGVTVIVRVAPLPPKAIPVSGTRVGLEDSPFNVRLAAGVTESPTVKARTGVEVSSLTVRSAMSEIVGGAVPLPRM